MPAAAADGDRARSLAARGPAPRRPCAAGPRPGPGVPAPLRPAAAADASGPADLVIVGPGEDEAGQAGWLTDAVTTAAARLSADGLLYVLAPPRARLRARRALRSSGLRVETAFLHLPDVERSRLLVPLERARRTTRSLRSRRSHRASAGSLGPCSRWVGDGWSPGFAPAWGWWRGGRRPRCCSDGFRGSRRTAAVAASPVISRSPRPRGGDWSSTRSPTARSRRSWPS